MIEAELNDVYAVVGCQDLLFQRFEFGCNVAFGIGKCLLANPLFGHFVLVGVAHLKVVAEHVIEANLQAAYTRAICLVLAYAFYCLAAVITQITQFVEFVIYSGSDRVGFVLRQRRIGHDLPDDTLAHLGAEADILAKAVQIGVILRLFANLLDGLQCAEGIAQLHHFPRTNSAC